jgi:hypothetical protein
MLYCAVINACMKKMHHATISAFWHLEYLQNVISGCLIRIYLINLRDLVTNYCNYYKIEIRTHIHNPQLHVMQTCWKLQFETHMIMAPVALPFHIVTISMNYIIGRALLPEPIWKRRQDGKIRKIYCSYSSCVQ